MAANAQHAWHARISRLVLAALLLIVALGATLRIYKLGAESLWLDEAFSIKISHNSLAGIIEETANDVHPPLYYFALHYWMLLFGDSEFSARLLSALFGILAILAIYKIAAQLFDRATGLLAASLLALSHFHLEFSQEARMYTLLTLLTLLSMHFFLKLFERSRSSALVGYVVSSALLMYTHVYSIFIIAAQNLYLLTLLFAARADFKRVLKRWLLAQGILIALLIPWLSVLAQQVSRVQKDFWIPRLPPRAIYEALVMYAGSVQLAWILLPLAGLGVFLGWKGRSEDKTVESPLPGQRERLLTGRLKIYLLLWWTACPVVLPFAVSQFGSPIFLPKYTIAALPAFIILAARGLLSLRFHQLRLLVGLLLLYFSLIALKNYFGAVRKDMWREAVARFEQLAKPNDLVLFSQQSGQFPFDYYLRRDDLKEKPFPDYHRELKVENVAELLKTAVEGHDRVWLVLSHPEILTPLVPQHLARWYDLAAHMTDRGVEIYLFEKRK